MLKIIARNVAPTKDMHFGYNLLNLRFLAKTVFRRFRKGRFLQVKRNVPRRQSGIFKLKRRIL
jgi:hypothetical protein